MFSSPGANVSVARSILRRHFDNCRSYDSELRWPLSWCRRMSDLTWRMGYRGLIVKLASAREIVDRIIFLSFFPGRRLDLSTTSYSDAAEGLCLQGEPDVTYNKPLSINNSYEFNQATRSVSSGYLASPFQSWDIVFVGNKKECLRIRTVTKALSFPRFHLSLNFAGSTISSGIVFLFAEILGTLEIYSLIAWLNFDWYLTLLDYLDDDRRPLGEAATKVGLTKYSNGWGKAALRNSDHQNLIT